MRKILCLNCFHHISAGDVYFKCPCPNSPCSQVLPHVKVKERLFRLKFWNRFQGNRRKLPVVGECPYSQKNKVCLLTKSIDRYCPHCFEPLHKEAGKLEDSLIVTLGPTGSGKSEYLRSLGACLGKNFAFRRILFDKSLKNPEKNKIPEKGFRFPPEVRVLTIEQESKSIECTVAFFDYGGELKSLNVEDFIFLKHCSALILTCDPLYNEVVLEMLLNHEEYKSFYPLMSKRLDLVMGRENPSKSILDKVLEYTKAMNIKIPIAIVITKSDLLRHPEIFDPKDSAFQKVHIDHGEFRVEEKVLQAAKWYMKEFEWEMYALLQTIQKGGNPVCYFVTSALGQPPQKGEIVQRTPSRVIDPFWWCLHIIKK